MGLIRLQLMCIHRSFAIRLPIAAEADPFDVETHGLNSAVTYHCQPVLESVFAKKQTKTRLGLKQIRYRYKGTAAESRAFTPLNFCVIVQIGKPQNAQYVPSPAGSRHQKAAASKQNKGLAEKKHITVQFLTNG